MKLLAKLLPLSLGEGEGTDWREALPEEIRGDAAFTDIKDIGALGTSFINAQKLIGQPVIRIPSENAGEEDLTKFYEKISQHAPKVMPVPDLEDPAAMAAIYSKLGRPADADSYNIEGAELTPELKKAAHEMGLTNTQFSALYANMIKPNLEASAANAAKLKQGRDELAKEWGYAFQTKEKTAQAILEKTGAPAELIEAAKAGAINAETLRWMDSLATSLGTEGLDIINDNGGSTRMTPAEAKAQINEIMNNKEHAYWNPLHPDNKKAIKDMVDLQRLTV